SKSALRLWIQKPPTYTFSLRKNCHNLHFWPFIFGIIQFTQLSRRVTMHQIIINVVFYLLGLGAHLAMPVLAADAAGNAPLQCPAQPGLGPACAAADNPWLLPLAGNPINLINGNKYTLHEDLPSIAGATLLFIQRHYNAQSIHHSILGRGWSLHWDIRLQPQQRRLLLADGRQLQLTPHQLRRQQLPDTGFEVVLSPKNTLRFNAKGYLVGWHKEPHRALQLH